MADSLLDMGATENVDAETAETFNEEDLLGEEDEENSQKTNADLNETIKSEATDDLYDAVLDPGVISTGRQSVDSSRSVSSTTVQSKPLINATVAQHGPYGEKVRRYCIYVGNMTWWTTDEDLKKQLNDIEIHDIIDIKFYDNRSNGQSKGYALCVLEKEASQKIAIDKLNKTSMHGQALVCMQYSKQALAQFEAATVSARPNDRMRTAPATMGQPQPLMGVTPMADLRNRITNTSGPSITGASGNFLGRIRIGASGPQSLTSTPSIMTSMSSGHTTNMMNTSVMSSGRPPMQPQQMMQQRPPMHQQPPPQSLMQMNSARPPPMQYQQQPPPQQQMQMTRAPPPSLVSQPPPQQMHQTAMPPPGAHVNPAFYGSMAPHQPQYQQQQMHRGPPQQQQLSEAEFEEIMNRNRTVSSSAISRAVSDAAAQDFASAIETLATAISLIRQSRVANDERCRVLVSSLQDTLTGIESKSYGRSSRKDRHRSRSRSPSDRSRKHRRRSSRSRSPRYDYSPQHRSRRY